MSGMGKWGVGGVGRSQARKRLAHRTGTKEIGEGYFELDSV